MKIIHIVLLSAICLTSCSNQKSEQEKEALQIRKEAMDIIFMKGAKGNHKAIDLFGKAIEKAPHLPNLYITRASLYSDERDYDKALADLNKAIELDSNDADIWVDKAKIQLLMGDSLLAQKEIERAMVRYAENFDKGIDIEDNLIKKYRALSFIDSTMNSLNELKTELNKYPDIDSTRVIDAINSFTPPKKGIKN